MNDLKCEHCGCRSGMVEIDEEFDAYAPEGGTAVYHQAAWVCKHCDLNMDPCGDCAGEEEE